eukprot:jgi/Botrbrau1/21181/Bobra.0061s0072.1
MAAVAEGSEAAAPSLVDVPATQVEARLLVDAHTDLGESPTWDARTGRLYFVDINSCSIHVFTEETGEHFTIKANEAVGTVALTSDPDILLACLTRGVYEVHVSEKKIGQLVAQTPDAHGVEGLRFNDGKASPAGTLVVGRMHAKWREGYRGRLYKLEWYKDRGHKGQLVEVLSPLDVGLPNGMAWKDNVMYFVDTATGNITRYLTGKDGAPVRDQTVTKPVKGTVLITIPPEVGIPDGLTIDSAGRLWVALAEKGAVGCIDPKTAKLVQKVSVPVRRVTACTFGGTDLSELYVTSRQETGEDASEHWGAVYALRIPGVTGAAPAYTVTLPPGEV